MYFYYLISRGARGRRRHYEAWKKGREGGRGDIVGGFWGGGNGGGVSAPARGDIIIRYERVYEAANHSRVHISNSQRRFSLFSLMAGGIWIFNPRHYTLQCRPRR